MALPDNREKPLWWWCDALFMAPPVLAKLSRATGDRKYLDFMDRQWWITSGLLYSPSNHLFFRDQSFLDKHEANGSSLFWSRGNGWVFAALARVLTEMPQDYPSRPKYLAQYKEMAEELAGLQGTDGLWRPGLLDAAAYPLPENSGSAFFVYGLAWGINNGILDRAKYQPAVQKGWAGLLSHLPGWPAGLHPADRGSPNGYRAVSSYVFGSGAFLLAGSEVYRLARKPNNPLSGDRTSLIIVPSLARKRKVDVFRSAQSRVLLAGRFVRCRWARKTIRARYRTISPAKKWCSRSTCRVHSRGSTCVTTKTSP